MFWCPSLSLTCPSLFFPFSETQQATSLSKSELDSSWTVLIFVTISCYTQQNTGFIQSFKVRQHLFGFGLLVFIHNKQVIISKQKELLGQGLCNQRIVTIATLKRVSKWSLLMLSWYLRKLKNVSPPMLTS